MNIACPAGCGETFGSYDEAKIHSWYSIGFFSNRQDAIAGLRYCNGMIQQREV